MLLSAPLFEDKRLEVRMNRILSQIKVEAGESIPNRIKNRDQIKAYYRFINHKKVSPTVLSTAYQQETLRHARLYRDILLSVQDLTELDFTNSRPGALLGPMEYKYRKGMYLHNHILMDRSGVPLGLFSQRFIVRDMAYFGQGNARRFRPFEEKESYRWFEEYQALEAAFADDPSREVLCICDREADIHELLQARTQPHVHYLIRSRHNRKLDQSKDKIYQEVAGQAVSFTYDLALPKSDKHPARTAHLSVRYTPVTIHAGYRPKGQQQLRPQTVNLIEIKEQNPPQKVKPICWHLLTSMPIDYPEQAQQLIQFYCLRWVIERFHYVLKQGFKIEERQIKDTQALQNAIIIDSWPAIQICATHYLAHNHPNMPLAQMTIDPDDYQLIIQFLLKRYNIKLTQHPQPTVEHFHRALATLGGFQGQKNKKPGMITLARGWKALSLIKEAIAFQIDVGNR